MTGKKRLTKSQRAINSAKFDDIKSAKHRIIVSFNDELKAKRYLRSKGYRYQELYSHKEDRALLYKNFKNSWVKLASTFDYLNDNTMEMGTVWNIETI
tara:strand:- start:311 stop:604 length:294 start_codon:yes stop_codon:yes gene_type:complete